MSGIEIFQAVCYGLIFVYLVGIIIWAVATGNAFPDDEWDRFIAEIKANEHRMVPRHEYERAMKVFRETTVVGASRSRILD